MGFVDAVKTFYRRYFDFKGRSSRSEFWWYALFSMVAGLVLMLPWMGAYMNMVTSMSAGGTPDLAGVFGLTSIPYFLFMLVNIIPGIALNVRRFHDHDRSGWWFLLMYILMIIPLIGLIAAIAYIVFMCRRGTVGPNRFGMDPLGGGSATFD